jgi:protein PhnA
MHICYPAVRDIDDMRPIALRNENQIASSTTTRSTWRIWNSLTMGAGMTDQNDDYVYDEATGEWRPASEIAAAAALASEVRDASGNLLVDGDSVTLIKDLKVKGAGQTLKQGTVIKSIRLTDNPEEIDCRHDAIKGLVLRTEFVRKR